MTSTKDVIYDLAVEIGELRAENNHLKKMLESQKKQGWIPCRERLPEPSIAVLGYAPKYQNIFALYYDSECGWMIWNPICDNCLPNSQGDIVAWMPLPEPYKGEEE